VLLAALPCAVKQGEHYFTFNDGSPPVLVPDITTELKDRRLQACVYFVWYKKQVHVLV